MFQFHYRQAFTQVIEVKINAIRTKGSAYLLNRDTYDFEVKSFSVLEEKIRDAGIASSTMDSHLKKENL